MLLFLWGSAIAGFSVELFVEPDEGFDPADEEAAVSSFFEVEETGEGSYDGADAIYDEVPHGVDEAGFLHIHSKDLIHGELEDFPDRADADGEAEAEDGDGDGGRFVAVALKEHEDAKKAEEAKADG